MRLPETGLSAVKAELLNGKRPVANATSPVSKLR